MRLYFARHGESLANTSRTFSNRDPWHPLTERGEQQAAELAETLAAEQISHIFHSPAVRAQQTAAIAGAHLGLKPSTAEALREFDVGRWEGTGAAEGWAEWERVVARWRTGAMEPRVSDGESLAEIVSRLQRWLDTIQAELGPSDRVLAIAHGGIYHAALPHIFAGIDREFCWDNRLGHCDTVLAEDDGPGRWRALRWGDKKVPRPSTNASSGVHH